MKKHNGFTLIELMVVVAIIGIVGALAFPSYDAHMKKTKRADAKVGLTKLADKQERFYLQNNIYTNSFAAAGLNTSTTSDEGYYTFSIPAADAAGYTLTATRVGGADADCLTLTLSSTGARTATGADTSKCW